MLENLKPTARITAPQGWNPAITFDGVNGEATTPGIIGKPDFTQYLIDAGYDPTDVEVIGNIRTSRWQRYDGEWLTAYKFAFTVKHAIADLPLLWKTAKQGVKKPAKTVESDKAFVVLTSDFQIGKTDERGGTEQLLTRIFETFDRIEAQFKKGKYSRIIIVDVGDIIEGFSNTADMQQAVTNDLALTQQVDVAISLIWDIVKRACKFAPTAYLSVASNHCQVRLNKQRVGKPGIADWGIHIAQQIHRLGKETDLPVTVHIPQPDDESLAYDVFGDGFHVLGVWHGHQANRPEGHADWWRKSVFGHQPVAAATIGIVGHHHHLRIQELGQSSNGGSRYLVQAKTMDSGSGWYRLTSGEDSQPGIVCFELTKNIHFQGSVVVM